MNEKKWDTGAANKKSFVMFALASVILEMQSLLFLYPKVNLRAQKVRFFFFYRLLRVFSPRKIKIQIIFLAV